ncbi:MAG: acylneuraminate cytidylyltransferase family protein [bacterium]|nr:acylneuraminate cytidylyltransferase family protein [bacterium]MDZ4285091.1 acylneuraminate cytidylyltransferase family protein [Patescibacteria group bacterium]
MNAKTTPFLKQRVILGVITARGGSKGIPGKNIKPLGGKPLIAFSIEAARGSTFLTHCIVSTDSEEIADVARTCGGKVPFVRPAELATDHAPHVPVMQHAISFMEEREGRKFDYAVILQPTSPFRTPEDIDETLRILIESGAESAVTLVEVANADHPVKAKRIENGRVLPYTMAEPEGARRQDLPTAYRRSGAVYAMRRDTIMAGRLYGESVVGHVVPRERSVDIDEPLDWLKAEWMLENLKRKGYRF